MNDIELVNTNPIDIIKAHGPAGGLLLRLQRSARLGWFLFFITAFLFVGYVFIERIIPKPVLAVDESGRVLGTFEYVGGGYRTNEEYTEGVSRWMNYYLSFNAATIYQDVALAASAMHDVPENPDDARDKYFARLKSTNLPNTIANSDSRSHLDHDEGYPKVVEGLDKDGCVTVQDKGTIRILVSGVKRPQRYDIFTKVKPVRRSTLYALGTMGLKIMDVWEG